MQESELMNDLIAIMKLFKKKEFIETCTQLNGNSGINNRMAGKGTQPKDGQTTPKPGEWEAIKTGLQLAASKANSLAAKIQQYQNESTDRV